MKLERFYIGDYRVLQTLNLDFERLADHHFWINDDNPPAYALDFLVGVNGTGKSTVLRLLGRLFGLLHWRDFNYEFRSQLS
jgi:ABC-type transport system involved in cytochrome c biogenesis ATPase subunit